MKRIFILMALAIVLLITVACEKKNEKITSMNDLKVNEDFSFNTVKPVQLTLNSVNSIGEAVPSVAFRIYRSGQKTLMSGKTNSQGRFVFMITVPSYESKLYLEVGEQSTTLTIPASGELTHTFVGTTSKAKTSYSYFTPAENQFATLAYEDMWPQNGDYDINDLVVDINAEEIWDEDTWQLTTVKFKYKIRAIGARRTIGFATTLPDWIVATGEPVSTTSNPVWRPEYNTLVFFNNARDLVNDDSEQFFNTEHTQPYNSDAEIEYEVTLPVTEDWSKAGNSTKMVAWMPWNSAPFNPFIFINNDQSYQVHLKRYPVNPAYANMTLFNTLDDNSDISDPTWPNSYQNYNYCPWAFYIAESTPYPLEKKDILHAFPQFADWALSDGWDYTEWYLNYDEDYIYNPIH